MLPKYTKINQHTIKLINVKESSYVLIYSLELVELKRLKIYIKTNLANDFICLSKSLASTFVLFVCQLNAILCLCVDY